MKFKFQSSEGKSIIEAIIEKEEEKKGYRAEGPNQLLEMVNNKVIFDYEVNQIHPDILALLCITCFYPYLDEYVTFPYPVSPKIEEAFGDTGVLELYEVIDGIYKETNGLKITNVDNTVAPYNGDKIAISFGGGIDSSALYQLFPEAIVIHEQTKLINGEIQFERTVDTIEWINKNGGRAFSFSNNNRRGISRPSVWPGWAACTCNALLLATDLNLGYIMTGSVLGSSFLSNGKKYYPGADPKRGNIKWCMAFEKVGLPMFSPAGGLSEVSNAIILRDTNVIDKAHWCFSDKGTNCRKCWKCFRRDTILHAIGELQVNEDYWERYNNDFIKDNLKKRPLYFAHVFSYTLRKLDYINWLKPYIPFDVEDTSSWIDKYYSESIKLVPEELRNLVTERIGRYIKSMSSHNEIENWDYTDLKENR